MNSADSSFKVGTNKFVLFVIGLGAAILAYLVSWYLWENYPLQAALLLVMYFFGGAAFTGWKSAPQIASSIGILIGVVAFYVSHT
jgi:uncharacterized membrane protein YqjE